MSLEVKINSLRMKHKELDTVIEVLEAERAPDDIISIRKKEKLAIKDELIRLEKFKDEA